MTYLREGQVILLWLTSGWEKVTEPFLLLLFPQMPRCNDFGYCALNPMKVDSQGVLTGTALAYLVIHLL